MKIKLSKYYLNSENVFKIRLLIFEEMIFKPLKSLNLNLGYGEISTNWKRCTFQWCAPLDIAIIINSVLF